MRAGEFQSVPGGFLYPSDCVAESEGFEPPIPFRVCRFSRPVPSTARPTLRCYSFTTNSIYGGSEFNNESLPIPKAARDVRPTHRKKRDGWGTQPDDRAPACYFVPFGYTSILLASPVFSRAMALEKSFIEMRSVITGCRSRRPLFKSAVIWYQVWYMRRPLMP